MDDAMNFVNERTVVTQGKKAAKKNFTVSLLLKTSFSIVLEWIHPQTTVG